MRRSPATVPALYGAPRQDFGVERSYPGDGCRHRRDVGRQHHVRSRLAAANARAEMMRKVRIGAGGFQALGLTYRLLHPRHGICAFAFWGHKVLRWCVPLLLLMALAANVALIGAGFYHLLLGLQAAGA